MLSAQNIIVPGSGDAQGEKETEGQGERVMVEESVRVGAGCMKPFVGEGWRSAVRVRLLHGVVRRRVMGTIGRGAEKGKKPGYDFDKGESSRR